MNSNVTWMTAQTPSAFGMPISGHAFCVPARATGENSALASTLVVRDRAAVAGILGATTQGKGRVQAHVPGTHAWSPPIC